MNARRGLKPVAGVVFVCIGTGAVVAAVSVASDPNSDARKYVQSRALEARKRVLLKALVERLEFLHRDAVHTSKDHAYKQHGGEQHVDVEEQMASSVLVHSLGTTRLPSPAIEQSDTLKPYKNKFYVVTGAGTNLTSQAAQHLSRNLAFTQRSGSGNHNYDRNSYASRLRLAVPYGCRFGTGKLSALVEEQLLPREVGTTTTQYAGSRLSNRGSGSSEDTVWQRSDLAAPRQANENDDSPSFETKSDSSPSQEIASQPSPPNSPPASGWDSAILRITRAFINAQQIDRVALWALKEALLKTREHSPATAPEIVQDEGVDLEKSAADALGNFCLELSWPGDENIEGGSADEKIFSGERHRQQQQEQLCEELVRWGWDLTERGLGDVVVSSPNPWMLVELQEALRNPDGQQSLPPGSSAAFASGEDTATTALDRESATSSTIDPAAGASEASVRRNGSTESERTVVVVRVALPSLHEREQVVRLVAEELSIDNFMSPIEVAMIADLTGGRRTAIEKVLRRVRVSAAATVSEACRSAVDDEALALAIAWGLVPPDVSSNGPGERAVPSIPGLFGDVESPTHSKDLNGLGGSMEDSGQSAALWEAMGVLSLPKVVVGAGSSPLAPLAPEGTMAPGQLLEACSIDPDLLFRLTREGWLEISPAAPPGSGTILFDPEDGPWEYTSALPATEHNTIETSSVGDDLSLYPSSLRRRQPGVTVHTITVPIDSLARLDKSFVGAAPLRLAAFRRMIDLATKPTRRHTRSSTPKIEEDDHGTDSTSGWSSGRANIETKFGGADGVRQDGFGVGGVDGVVGVRRHVEELERAGCLIEASVLGRLNKREQAYLAEDARTLHWKWTELDKVRNRLQREGKGQELSDGEWAEVQLELIRQERAAVAIAHEMRARRARLLGTLSEAAAFQKRGMTYSTSSTQSSPEAQEIFQNLSRLGIGQPGLEIENKSEAAEPVEETVISDAEGGVRLMPLRAAGNAEKRSSFWSRRK